MAGGSRFRTCTVSVRVRPWVLISRHGAGRGSLSTMAFLYTKEHLQKVIAESHSYCGALRLLDLSPSGGSQMYLRRKVKELGISTEHFTGKRTKRRSQNKLTPDQVLVVDRSEGRREEPFRLRRALVESGIPEVCSVCKLAPEWQGKPLRLQVDHQDGNGLNNTLKNLRFICPNCHSQTDNFGVLNLKSRSRG